jgi:hypothetical protein
MLTTTGCPRSRCSSRLQPGALTGQEPVRVAVQARELGRRAGQLGLDLRRIERAVLWGLGRRGLLRLRQPDDHDRDEGDPCGGDEQAAAHVHRVANRWRRSQSTRPHELSWWRPAHERFTSF